VIEEEYDSILRLIEVDDKPVYVAKANNKYFVVWEGEEGQRYEDIDYLSIFEYNKKPTYKADSGVSWRVISGVEEVGRRYPHIGPLTEVNNKLTYSVQSRTGWMIIFGDEIVGTEYDYVHSPAEVNGRLAYFALKDKNRFVVYGDSKTKNYHGFSSQNPPTEINNSLAYIVRENEKEYLVYGEHQGNLFDSIKGLTEVVDKPAYKATIGDKSFIVYGEKELGKEYDFVGSPTEVDGKLAYCAMEVDVGFVVFDGRKQIRHSKVYHPIEVDGKLTYKFVSAGRSVISYGGVDVGRQYDQVYCFAEVNNSLAYIAKKDDMWYMVQEVSV